MSKQGFKLARLFKGDRGIWAMVVLFMFYSLLAVYSSSVSVAFLKYDGNTTYFLRSQFFMLLFGVIIISNNKPSKLQNILFAGQYHFRRGSCAAYTHPVCRRKDK